MRCALIFDPSSTAIGWAVMSMEIGTPPIAAGIIKRPSGWDSQLRMLSCLDEVWDLIQSLGGKIDRIVVEVPGKGQSRKKVKDDGRSTPIEYSMAVGMVYAVATRSGLPVVTVRSDHWANPVLGGIPDKEKRLDFLKYMGWDDGAGDPGRDRCDAISLGNWYRQREGFCEPDQIVLKMTPKRVHPDHLLRLDKLERIDGYLRPKGARWKPDKP